MTRVLPEPAPASTSSGPSVVVTASRCAGFRSRSRLDMERSLFSAVERTPERRVQASHSIIAAQDPRCIFSTACCWGRRARRFSGGAAPGAVWLHAVSVGEALAVAPLLQEFRRRFPGRRLLVSTTTRTGQELAARRLEADATFYFPLDFGFACRRTLAAVKPALVVIAETEIWPRA